MLGAIIAIGILALIIFGILWWSGLIYFFTFHDRTLTISNSNIDLGAKGSHYLVHGTDKQIIELERLSWGWDKNIDVLLNEVQQNKGKEITFGCWGFRADFLYWYSNCDTIKDIKNVTGNNV